MGPLETAFQEIIGPFKERLPEGLEPFIREVYLAGAMIAAHTILVGDSLSSRVLIIELEEHTKTMPAKLELLKTKEQQ